MMKLKTFETAAVVAGLGAYAEFFHSVVPTPLGVILALGLLPTGDLIRWITAAINRRTQAERERDA